MKKIANITIRDNNNYGNRLQLYAMQQILKPYGQVCDVQRPYDAENFSKCKLYKIILKDFIKTKILSFMPKCKRLKRFLSFNKQNIKTSKIIFYKNVNYKKLNDEFDYFVVGSDQIWNPGYFGDNMYINMLGFASDEKKVAVAPSVALGQLSNKQQQQFKQYLPSFKHLSCREQQGADLITSIVQKPVTALVDPTLMLSSSDWDKIIKKPKFHNEQQKYVLLCFLGDISELAKYVIDKYAKDHGLKIIDLLDRSSKYYTCGPSEFLYLVKYSSLVCTDSFHASVLSYIYNRPFKIFERSNGDYMTSRITNIKNVLNLPDSVIYKGGFIEDFDETIEYDKEKLKLEQKKFNDYLQKVFKG